MTEQELHSDASLDGLVKRLGHDYSWRFNLEKLEDAWNRCCDVMPEAATAIQSLRAELSTAKATIERLERERDEVVGWALHVAAMPHYTEETAQKYTDVLLRRYTKIVLAAEEISDFWNKEKAKHASIVIEEPRT